LPVTPVGHCPVSCRAMTPPEASPGLNSWVRRVRLAGTLVTEVPLGKE
jgi:hypothetical protein